MPNYTGQNHDLRITENAIAGRITRQYEVAAGGTVKNGDPVYTDADGKIQLADASTTLTSETTIGIITAQEGSAISPGQLAEVVLSGEVGDSSYSFTPAEKVFVSTSGVSGDGLAQAGDPEFPGGDIDGEVLIEIAVARNSNTIVVGRQQPIEISV